MSACSNTSSTGRGAALEMPEMLIKKKKRKEREEGKRKGKKKKERKKESQRGSW